MKRYEIHKAASFEELKKLPSLDIDYRYFESPDGITAHAQIGYSDTAILVHLFVEESVTRAEAFGPFGTPCEDSCMEFFFAPKMDDARYFNFEWNKLCNAYVGFGGERKTRVRQILKNPQATFAPESCDTPDGWAIEYRIPRSFIRMYVPEFEFRGEAACNFYKCGDELPTPHFLSWNPIEWPEPSFHRPEQFGKLIFE